MSKKNLAVKLDEETDLRLTKAAEGAKLNKHQLMIAAIEAAIDAIEANGGRIVMPMEFDVRHIPAPRKATPRAEDLALAAEEPPSYPAQKRA